MRRGSTTNTVHAKIETILSYLIYPRCAPFCSASLGEGGGGRNSKTKFPPPPRYEMGRGRFHLTFFPSPALAPTLTRHADVIATEPTSLMLWDELVLRAFFDEQRPRCICPRAQTAS
jgi:hypothetical protein